MSKTELTLQLEDDIWKATQKMGTYGCFEVTIGSVGNGRVDYMTFDSKGIWRCYEIKCSVSDFHSKAEKSFVGHFNYFVLTAELYERVKDEIPEGIGVYVHQLCVRKPKKRDLAVSENILKDSFIRSLSREYQRTRKSENINYMECLKREADYAVSSSRQDRERRHALECAIIEKYGTKELHELYKKYRDG